MSKKCIYSFCIAMMLFQYANAQFSIGIKSGYTRAWQDYGDLIALPRDARVHIHGFHISTVSYFEISKYISLGVEPGFVRRGAACVPGFEFFNNQSKLFLNYVELPALVQLNLPFNESKFSLNGKLGFGVSYLLSGYEQLQITTESEIIYERNKLDVANDSDFKRMDKGIYTGIGAAYQMKQYQLFLNLDYYHGFTNVELNTVSRNRGLNASLGFNINL